MELQRQKAKTFSTPSLFGPEPILPHHHPLPRPTQRNQQKDGNVSATQALEARRSWCCTGTLEPVYLTVPLRAAGYRSPPPARRQKPPPQPRYSSSETGLYRIFGPAIARYHPLTPAPLSTIRKVSNVSATQAEEAKCWALHGRSGASYLGSPNRARGDLGCRGQKLAVTIPACLGLEIISTDHRPPLLHPRPAKCSVISRVGNISAA